MGAFGYIYLSECKAFQLLTAQSYEMTCFENVGEVLNNLICKSVTSSRMTKENTSGGANGKAGNSAELHLW